MQKEIHSTAKNLHLKLTQWMKEIQKVESNKSLISFFHLYNRPIIFTRHVARKSKNNPMKK